MQDSLAEKEDLLQNLFKQSKPPVKEKQPHFDDLYDFEPSPANSQESGGVEEGKPLNPKKRKLDQISKNDAVYDEFEGEQPIAKKSGFQNPGSPKKKKLLTEEIAKNNALERLKDQQEAKLTEHNQQIKTFEDVLLDFQVKHPIYEFKREEVFKSREPYAGYFILAIIEMLKYAVKEDYENQKTEIQLIPIALEYTKPSQSKVLQNAQFKNIAKRIKDRKANNKKRYQRGKQQGAKALRDQQAALEDSSEESKSNDDGMASEEDSDNESPGSFYVRFKEAVPPQVKKDMMVEDLWILMKRPMVTNQGLNDVTEVVFARAMWHSHNKQMKIKVAVLGSVEEAKIKVDQYKFAIKSVNLNGFSSLIENLIEFRERSNPYVDSMLSIKNTKAKFKVLQKCDPQLVEAVRQETCFHFKLNRD